MPLLASAVNGLWKKRHSCLAEALCLSAIEQARNPKFYKEWGVPDTLAGRFDCACLHMILLLRNIKKPLSQKVFDSFFSYTELTLREEGVSDLRVGKQVKKCAKFFYGAMKAYDEALKKSVKLEAALARNLFGGNPPKDIELLSQYVLACDCALREQDIENNDSIHWPILK